MADESILRKIEKCLALSKSSNEHEAAAALRQATKLMQAYNVTPEALAQAKIGTAKANTNAWSRPPAWEMSLLSVIKKAFGCGAIMNIGNGELKRLTTVEYIGLKHQAELAAYAHDVLRRQVEKARTAYTAGLTEYSTRGAKIAAGETFSRGYVEVLAKQAQALANTPEVSSGIRALKYTLLGGSGKVYNAAKTAFDYNAYTDGKNAGAGASLHRPMNGKERLKLN